VPFPELKRLVTPKGELKPLQCLAETLQLTHPGKIQGGEKRMIRLPPEVPVNGSHITAACQISHKFLKRNSRLAAGKRNLTLEIEVNLLKSRFAKNYLAAPGGNQSIVGISHDGHAEEVGRL